MSTVCIPGTDRPGSAGTDVLAKVHDLALEVDHEPFANTEHQSFTSSLNVAPGVNLGLQLEEIYIGQPVRGWRPVRAAALVFSKAPKPFNFTTPPRATLLWMIWMRVSSMRPVIALEVLVSAAMALIRSYLFIGLSGCSTSKLMAGTASRSGASACHSSALRPVSTALIRMSRVG